jgi:hypothetical protein
MLLNQAGTDLRAVRANRGFGAPAVPAVALAEVVPSRVPAPIGAALYREWRVCGFMVPV